MSKNTFPPQKELGDVKPLLTTAAMPREVLGGVAAETARQVILDPKDNFLVLDDLDRDPMIEPLDSVLPGGVSVSGAALTGGVQVRKYFSSLQIFFLYEKYFQRIISINGTQHLITTTPSRGGVAVSGVAPVPRITSQFIPGAVTKQVFISLPSKNVFLK